MNATEMTFRFLAQYRSRYDFVVDNAYIDDMEMDICAVKKTGYFDEIEIKVTKSDFLADFKKTTSVKRYGPFCSSCPPVQGVSSIPYDHMLDFGRPDERGHWWKVSSRYVVESKLKHERIQAGKGIANTFTFLMPVSLAEEIAPDLPSGYGLLGFDQKGIRRMRNAKKFHTNKISANSREKVLMKTQHRYWDLKRKNIQLQQEAAA